MLHQTSGRWRLGLMLAMVTALCWSSLPLALKVTLQQVDAITLTWFRFLFAALVMSAWLVWRRQFVAIGTLPRKHRYLLVLATLLLLGNYIGYILGVHYTSPTNSQLLIQLAPLLMALGGVLIFKEPFTRGQWLGLVTISVGLLLFFRDQLLGGFVESKNYVLGSGIIVAAALVWASYALIQKQLLMHLPSQNILTGIYILSAALLWPFAHPSVLLQLDATHWALLLFCAINTLLAYGAFAEALEHWHASRVSAILATTPLLCLLVVCIAHNFFPQSIAQEHVKTLGFVGAGLVVLGSGLVSLLGQSGAIKK